MATTGLEVRPEAEEYHIIDTDFHAGPAADMEMLFPYIDDEIVEQKLSIASPLSGRSGVMSYYGADKTGGYHTHGSAHTGEEVLDVLSQFSIDEVVLSPGTNQLSMVQYPVMKNAICSAVNEYFLDKLVPADESIKSHLALPMWDPEAAVRELDRHGDHPDVLAGYTWYNPYTPLFGEPRYDPVYDRLVELDIPLVMHVGGGTYPPNDIVVDSLRTRTETLSVLNSHYAIMNLANMIMTGVFEKYPDLTVVVQEAGVTWIPYVANELNEAYRTQPHDLKIAERMHEMGQEYLEKDPSEYLYDNCYVTTQPIALPDRRREQELMLELCRAEEMFLYSSDWPHPTLDPVDWLLDLPIDEAGKERILSENARECYGL